MTATSRLVCVAGAPGTQPNEVARALAALEPGLPCKALAAPLELEDLPAGTTVLLLAHDTPSPADAQADDAWRAALWKSQVPHQVIYGTDETVVTHAAQALGLLPMPPRRTMAAWACEKCSDPDCEHRLFQDLLAQRP